MKWPFVNDTSPVVKKMARRSLASDRRSARFLVLTIAVAVAMVLGVALISAGLAEEAKDPYRNQAQVSVLGPTDDQLAAMRASEEVDWVGEYAALGYSYQDGRQLTLLYADADYLTRQAPCDITGALPKAENEIMLTRDYLTRTGLAAEPGETVRLDLLGLGDDADYRLSGIVEQEDDSASSVYVNRTLAQRIAEDTMGGLQITAYTRLTTTDISADGIQAEAERVLTPLGIDSRQIYLTDYFAAMNGVLGGGLHLSIPMLALITGALAAVIIYGVFYTMIAKNVQTLGQLRTIGMTTRQTRRMMRAEGRSLAWRGILLGLALGIVVGVAVSPGGFRLRTALLYAAAIALGAWCMVMLALWRPTRIAAKTSPLEGARYLGTSPDRRAKRRVSRRHRALSPARLAKINLGRHPFKTGFTILTLAASGALFLSVATVAGSIDAEKQARFAYYPDGDIELNLQHVARSTFEANGEYNYGTRLQLEGNPFSDPALRAQLLAIPGVESVTPHKGIYATITIRLPMGDLLSRASTVPVLDRDDFAAIAPLLSDDVSYADVSAENAVLLSQDDGKAGDTVEIAVRGRDGKEFSYTATVAATYDPERLMSEQPLVPGSPTFMLTADSVTALTGVTDMTGVLTIATADGAYERVRAQVMQMAEASDEYDENDITQTIANIEEINGVTIRNLRLVAVILFLFGGISMANTLIVDFQNRRRLFGLLAVCGATRRQLAQMLAWEMGAVLALAALLSFVVGAVASAIACWRIDAAHHSISLALPWMEMGAFLGMILVIALALARYARRQLAKSDALAAIREE